MRYLALLITALAVTTPAFAHGGADPAVYVPRDHVVQGRPFPVVGADLDPAAKVTLRLGDRRLGAAETDEEGHFRTTVVAPADVADGYLELTATSAGGATARTLVRFGSAPVSAPGSARAPEGGGFPVLAAVLIGLAALSAAAGAYLLLRRR